MTTITSFTTPIEKGKGKITKTKERERGRGEERQDKRLEQKIINATAGFNNHFVRLLKKQLLDPNIDTICDSV